MKKIKFTKEFKIFLSLLFVIICLIIGISSQTIKEEVRFTHYYPYDQNGTTKTTASGLSTSDFILNKNGWYTYKNKVVIAAPTFKCTLSKTGICGDYNQLPLNYYQFNFYDEVLITINHHKYNAIVLDICGACYWDEEYQRIDIFVKDESAAVDGNGTIKFDKSIESPDHNQDTLKS